MDGHYFQRKSTYQLIQRLAEPMDWTIYVGLGATLDRTGASWESLVLSLFGKLGVEHDDSVNWISNLDLIGASTTIEAMYRSQFGNDMEAYTTRLRDDIRSQLYGPRVHLKGRLLEKLAEFAYINAKRERSVVFVTPNYDNYLDETLQQLPFAKTPRAKLRPRLVANISIDAAREDLPHDWADPGSVQCIHVHGIVGKTSNQQHNAGVPVLGELQYAESSQRTQKTLTQLFRKRNILVIGSSLRDGPLVNALIASRPTGDAGSSDEDTNDAPPIRVVIQPMQGREWQVPTAQLDGLLQLNRRRLAALGLTNTRPTLFSQSAQLISEISSSIVRGNGGSLSLETYPLRYDNRLEEWWRRWSAACKQRIDIQRLHHQWLQVASEITRRVLMANADEEIKVEIWVRWEPSTKRDLALWASSVGTWVAQGSMRRGSIRADSDYRSVQVFCLGAPMVSHVDSSAPDRWRSYFGFPIWADVLTEKSSRYGVVDQLPVGVLTIASMWSGQVAVDEHAPGCIGEHNLDRLARAEKLLQAFGQAILEASASERARVQADRSIRKEYARIYEALGIG